MNMKIDTNEGKMAGGRGQSNSLSGFVSRPIKSFWTHRLPFPTHTNICPCTQNRYSCTHMHTHTHIYNTCSNNELLIHFPFRRKKKAIINPVVKKITLDKTYPASSSQSSFLWALYVAAADRKAFPPSLPLHLSLSSFCLSSSSIPLSGAVPGSVCARFPLPSHITNSPGDKIPSRQRLWCRYATHAHSKTHTDNWFHFLVLYQHLHFPQQPPAAPPSMTPSFH